MAQLQNQVTQRTILVAVAGGSPAIVTETLWALAKRADPVHVDEVRVLTTAKGKSAILNSLLSPTNGKFKSCLEELEVTRPVKFNEGTIFVFKNGRGGELDDIRTDDDNKLAADQTCNLIREWTREDTRFVCSVAGGRKTMSVYLAMAMMLYGRADDRLFHVLVNPEEFELCRDFFHLYRVARELELRDRSGTLVKRISTADARIDLAEIPFVRLRVLDTKKAFGEAGSYSAIVDKVQDRLESLGRAANATVSIRSVRGTHNQIPVEVAGRICYLQAAPGFIYALVAVNAKSGGKGLRVAEIRPQDIKRAYSMLTGATYSGALWDTDFEFVTRWIEQAKLQQEYLGQGITDETPRAVANLLRRFRKSIEVAVSRANDSFDEADFPSRFFIANLDIKRRGKGVRALYAIGVSPDHISLPQPVKAATSRSTPNVG